MKKILIYYSFVMTSLLMVLGFSGAKSYPELISAIFFAPLGIYFGLLAFPKRSKAVVIVKTEPRRKLAKARSTEIAEEGKIEKEFDPERRQFLRIIGSAGASLFLLSVFTQKAHAAFFGSVPGPGTVALKDTTGNQVDPAQKQPTDGYNISKVDDSGSPAYYGFVNKDGAWFIMQEQDGTYLYAKGSSGFSTSWGTKETLDYNDFDEVF